MRKTKLSAAICCRCFHVCVRPHTIVASRASRSPLSWPWRFGCCLRQALRNLIEEHANVEKPITNSITDDLLHTGTP
jgi:hypothetical protein